MIPGEPLKAIATESEIVLDWARCHGLGARGYIAGWLGKLSGKCQLLVQAFLFLGLLGVKGPQAKY